MAVVHAAHLVPFAAGGVDAADNGVLLRVDLHVLFDADLIGIEPATLRVHVDPRLRDTEYEMYDGRTLRCGDDRPALRYLERRRSQFGPGPG